MNGANHRMLGISTYPFQIFGNGWEKVMLSPGDLPYKGDTASNACLYHCQQTHPPKGERG